MRVYRPMRWKARREVATPRLVLIVSMSPPGYSSARLRPRRAGLRFTRRFQLTNGLDPNQVPLGSRHKISSTPTTAATVCGNKESAEPAFGIKQEHAGGDDL